MSLASSSFAIAVVAMLAFAGPSAATGNHDSHQGGTPAAAAASVSEGTVRKIDKAAGKLTIAHGPLENLGMPPMTMVFRTAEPSMLEQVKAGDRIRFIAERIDGVFTVTSLEAAN
jgi:Cu/Ag efflux protein CusF